MIDRPSLRLSAALLLTGQILYILISQLHADRAPANYHAAAFADYASSGIWTAVHIGQFAAMAVLLAGLITLFSVIERPTGLARWIGRFGVISAVAALALYGVLQAVDGVALKQAVNAWAVAPEAEKATRFANAEAVRWLEWGVRSYQDFLEGLALLLLAVTMAPVRRVSRPIPWLAGFSGLILFAQGWVVGSEGFSRTHVILIVLAFAVNLAWMIWLSVAAWRMRDSQIS